MAKDLSNVQEMPYIEVVNQGTTWLQILIPSGCNQISVGSETSKIYFGRNNATDGGAVNASYRAFVPAGNIMPVKIGIGNERTDSVFIAASAGTADITIILEEAR
jgi:hypothetical protein